MNFKLYKLSSYQDLVVGLVLLEHGGLSHILPLAVHLDMGQMGHVPDTQGYLGPNHLLSLTPSKSYRWGGGGEVVSHEILVTARVQIPLSLSGFDS